MYYYTRLRIKYYVLYINENKELCLTLSKQRSRRYPEIKITDVDYADDLEIFADSSRNAEKLHNILE